ncbi:MAG: mandelate racemase/muconate lactonizing enzyme family protein [Symbiobacterium sp.]|uniref:mandelate racemase/muconate lactonizing enzyme family protein n=1 Tax=Symbiobacterium sp. TaxID=1971213 RepID=UPI00346451B2
MRITQVEVIPVKIPPEEIYLGGSKEGPTYYYRPGWRCVYSRMMETVFVKITAEDGTTGWGEALAPVAPEVTAGIIRSLFTPLLVGADPLATEVLNTRMYDAMRERGHVQGFFIDAIAGVDIALWDLKGRLLGLPVHRLLGGPYARRLPCYVSGLPRPTDAERAELAREWAARGFHRVKLAIGTTIQEDLRTVEAVRDALGEGGTVFVDAHWHYTLPEAMRFGRALEALGVGFLEAPMLPENLDAHAELARQLDIAIAIGEGERTRYQFKEILVRGAADILQPDVGRTGISELKKIAGMAEAWNVPVAPHLSVGQGVMIAATLQVAAAIPNLFILEYQPNPFNLANQFLAKPLVCEDGFMYLPEGPGLGVELDEERIRHHAVQA